MHTAEEVILNPELLPEVFEGLNAGRAVERYGAANLLIALSERAPEILYFKFDFFAGLLGGESKVLHWNALAILANLARVDKENKIEAIFEKYFKPVRGPVMITAGNVMKGGAKIAAAKPELAPRIAAEILRVETARYATPECRRIALGHAIAAFDVFFDRIEDKEAVLALVRKQLKSSRSAVRKRAEKFLAKYAPAGLRKASAARA